MNYFKHLFALIALTFVTALPMVANEGEDGKLNVSEIVVEHIKDSHEWHVTDFNGKPIIIHLPVIVHTNTGWHIFMTSEFSHEAENGMRKGPYNLALCDEGENAGKVVELDEKGNILSIPFDISITKTVAVMFINVIILLLCVVGSARWYNKRSVDDSAPKGFVGFIEMIVMYVVDEIIKPGVGKGYERYVPYLLTCFFFIFTCNVMGLIPFPPGGGNVTGNIAVTFFLAFCTFVIVQFSGNKHYWKDIFWPDVPTWLKAPIPIIPVIEFVGIFTKPFALMIRLFANMMAGHAIAVAIICIIFMMASAGVGMLAGMGMLSVIMSIFMMCLECLVCFIQAMVFTMLSATFIGLARVEPEH
ncbi:MAG: F0F1 ATP synthase subunit A [Prevotellaceae bacterium]|nr:F0F1 ATP synthase subunit A [Prevotellaceae bacterium]